MLGKKIISIRFKVMMRDREMTTKVLAMVTINEGEPQALAHYLKVTEMLMTRVDAKITKRFHVKEVVIGEPLKTVILTEYPNRDAVTQVFESEEYKALKATREKAFTSYVVSVVCDAEFDTD